MTTIDAEEAPVRSRLKMLIQAPPEDVYAAFVEPDGLTQFWLSKASGPLRIVDPMHWSFMAEGAEVDTTTAKTESGEALLPVHISIDGAFFELRAWILTAALITAKISLRQFSVSPKKEKNQ